ncbi:MAG: GTP cyclohydrolase FolE2 [Anaerovoracaceae bacterium]|jgi:GTP cyclohydrolase I
MKDVQSEKDQRNIYLNEVGIKDLYFPIEIKNGEGEWIPVTASISMYADLDADQKGTHMSRFVEIIQENHQMDIVHMKKILQEIREKLNAETSYLHVLFDYFVWKEAPVTHLESYLKVGVEYYVVLRGDDELEFNLTVHTPVNTLCPCSKAISESSAHNQRAIVSITVKTDRFLWIEDLVDIAEQSGSSPVYTLLKRPDEKFVTEYAYDHPKFVEDVARDAKMKIDEIPVVREYVIEVESCESIHNHSAYARVVGKK